MKKVTEKTVDEYLDLILEYFEKDNSFQMRKLSNELIEEAMTTEDDRMVELSLITYTLSKLVLKSHFTEDENWPEFKKSVINHLTREKEKPSTRQEVPHMLTDILKHIHDFDREAGNYSMNIIEQVRVKQASRLYALGLSLSKSAELTKVGKKELLNYVGSTRIHDRPFTQTKNLIERYNKTKEILNKEH